MTRYKKFRRLLAMVLSLILVFSIMPAIVFAQNDWGGTGVAEVQKDPSPNADTGLCAMGNNLVLQDGSNGGLTRVYYADAFGGIVSEPIDLSTMGLEITGDSAGGFDLKDIRLWGTYTGRYNSDASAFADLDVVIWMQGGTLSEIMTGNGSTAVSRSLTVYMSGGTLTGENITFNSAITANTTYVSGGRIEQNLNAQLPRYLSGSPSIGGDGCGITVKAGEKFYFNGALNGASVYVVPQADFADGTVIAEGSGYQITENDISQLHLTGDYAAGKELYLENNAVKIRTAQTAVAQDPYEISTPEQLMEFAVLVNGGNNGANAVLTADIDMSGQSWTGIASHKNYTGVFDGQGHTISNLTGTEGLFVNNAGTVKNVRLENVALTKEGGNLGAVVGVNTGTVFNCFSSGSITGTGSNAYSIGGLIGHNNGGILSGSSSSCTVAAKTAGGLVGSNWNDGGSYGKITACIYTGNAEDPVEGDNNYSNSTDVYYKDENGQWKSYPSNTAADENAVLQSVNGYIAENGGTFILSGDGTTYPTSAVSYLDYTENGFVTKYVDTYTEINSENPPTTWASGWYVVDGEVTIDSRVTVSGDVKLILKDGANLTVNGGIDVSGTSNSFTVYAQSANETKMGSMTAAAADGTGNAGIGSSGGQTAGAITINGGKIIATGGGYSVTESLPGDPFPTEKAYTGAGIGGGEKSSCSTITINGGIVTATSGRGTDFWQTSNSAAIGNGGYNAFDGMVSKQPAGTITINGGIVTANGINNGAGIGGGEYDPIKSVIITNGNIIASSEYGAGIGAGNAGDSGTITIEGGTVKALSEAGSGIGGGYNGDIQSVTITNGEIAATSDRGAGIGSCAYMSDAKVTISGGRVTAASTDGGNGIGVGKYEQDRDDNFQFSTGDGGTAIIIASSIRDQEGKDNWNGLIFEDNQGKIYGESYTLEEDFTILQDKTLTIEKDKTLVINNGIILTNDGAIHINEGGAYSGSLPAGNPIAYQIQWDTDGDGDVEDTTYVVYGGMPEHTDGIKEADAQYTYIFTKWSPVISEVTGPAVYKAQFDRSLRSYTVTLPQNTVGYTVNYSGYTTVNYGTVITFSVDIADGYSQTDNFKVKANGQELSSQSGSYSVTVQGDTFITVEGVEDITAPSNLTVSYETNSFKQFLNTITFGLFFKDTVTVTISAADTGSGVKEFTYQLGDGDLQTVAAQNGSVTFNVEPEFKGNIKNVTATDNAGNTSEGIDYEYFAVEKK